MGFFDRQRKVDGGGSAAENIRDADSLKRYPTLVEVMTAKLPGDKGGGNRMSLSIWVSEGTWRAILKDKGDAVCLWLTAGTLEGLFKSLEANLVNPDAVWRADRYQGFEQANRKKRG